MGRVVGGLPLGGAKHTCVRDAPIPKTIADDDLEAAWGEVFEALPAVWSVGRPSYHDERHLVDAARLRPE